LKSLLMRLLLLVKTQRFNRQKCWFGKINSHILKNASGLTSNSS
jgi:hypothetical protein